MLELRHDPAGQGQLERSLAAGEMPLRLLQREDGPAHGPQHLPIGHPDRLDGAFRGALVAAVEGGAAAAPAGLARRRAEAPAFGAEPADILVRLAPSGEFPVEDRRETE